MIERYSITSAMNDIHERFSVDVPDFYRPHYNAAPTQLLPVVTAGSKGVSLFYWGIPPDWAKNKAVSEKIINIKVESLREKPSLRKAMFRKRCIILADGFYAWKKLGKKTLIPHRFVLENGQPFSFAGVWEDFEDQAGDENHTFMMLTIPAQGIVNPVTDRMPLMLNRESEKVWLDENADEGAVSNQLLSSPLAGLTCYTVSPSISTSNLDVPSLIIPTPPADQYGNLTLFD
ncbi:MAG TPA: SOS response-associated peptidase [Cyclobacteriaceae bacterium]|nr:SOS response-associated peptidase [Cyclobacteriaceae bacterium]